MVNGLSTEELTHGIREVDNAKELKEYLFYQDMNFCGDMFGRTLSSLWEKTGFTKQKMIEISYLNASYVYDLFNDISLFYRTGLRLNYADSILQCLPKPYRIFYESNIK